MPLTFYELTRNPTGKNKRGSPMAKAMTGQALKVMPLAQAKLALKTY